MNSNELKNILKRNHRPFSLAVEAKMRSLQRDNVFEKDDWEIDFAPERGNAAKNETEKEKVYNFEEAAGASFGAAGKTAGQNCGKCAGKISDKIAMLRGIIHAAGVCKTYHKSRYGRA